MLPSDPGYIPAATNQAILDLPLYQWLLAHNTDPYASHSRDEEMIKVLESSAGTS